MSQEEIGDTDPIVNSDSKEEIETKSKDSEIDEIGIEKNENTEQENEVKMSDTIDKATALEARIAELEAREKEANERAIKAEARIELADYESRYTKLEAMLPEGLTPAQKKAFEPIVKVLASRKDAIKLSDDTDINIEDAFKGVVEHIEIVKLGDTPDPVNEENEKGLLQDAVNAIVDRKDK